MAIIDFFDQGWRRDPSAIAYVHGDATWTFDEARAISARIAHKLIGLGLRREATAAVLSPNDPLAWICVLGIWRAGLAWVPLNPARPAHDNEQLLDAFDCEVLFVHRSLLDMFGPRLASLPKLREVVALGETGDDWAPSLDHWAGNLPSTPPRVDHAPDDVVAVFPTGGTTGLPKGVMNTHRSFGVAFAHQMLATHYPADAPIVNLVAAPMTHAAGVMSMPATARGGRVVVIERPEAEATLEAIERHRVTELFLPPTVIYRLLESPTLGRRDLSSLRYLIYGAAPMSTEKLRRSIELLGPVMTELYGQVEAFAGISFLRPDEHLVGDSIAPEERLGSCGRPYPLVTVEVFDDDGRPVPSGEPGEICVRGDIVMKGYYNAPEATAATLRNGWLHTGDVGHLDGEGYLHITDRKKDLIISGGYNVYPSEVEQVIWGHAAVRDCAVIGVPSDEWGEAVKAVVELVPGATVGEDELIALCRERLGSIRAPRSIDVVAALPRSANGKVLKKDLREQYWAGHARRI